MAAKTYQLHLRIIDKQAVITKQIRTPILIGRSDAGVKFEPDIDLTLFGGDEAGVSRRHVLLVPDSSGFLIKDLNSTNGTFINNQELKPHLIYRISSGDELCLGHLRIQVHYQSPKRKLERPTNRLRQLRIFDLLETIRAPRYAPLEGGEGQTGTGDRRLLDNTPHLPPMQLSPDQMVAFEILRTIIINKPVSEKMQAHIARKAVEHPDWQTSQRLAVLRVACSFGYITRDNAELLREERQHSQLQFKQSE